MKENQPPYKLAFLGAGNMAEALLAAALAEDVLGVDQVIAADPSADRRQTFAQIGVHVTDSNREAIAGASKVVLAIKPQMLDDLSRDLREHGQPEQVIISIMAGISTANLEQSIGRPSRIVRVMPNTPLLAGCGMAGVCLGQHAQDGDDQLAVAMLSSGQSKAIRVDESQMDAITAISGSGPAYLFYLAQIMEQAAADLGLAEHGRTLTTQTLLGAARLLDQASANGQGPADLRAKVTSPGGTTEAACRHLDEQGADRTWIDAIKAAEARSRTLGNS